MKKIYHTITVSERNKHVGLWEDKDFGKIELFTMPKENKELIVSYTDYKTKHELIEVDGKGVYEKVHKRSYLGGFSTEDEEKIMKKQGYYSEKTAIELMLKIRKATERTFTFMTDFSFILIGKTLYVRRCNVEDLVITVQGNTLFAHWISIDFGTDKDNEDKEIILNKFNFNRIVNEQFARWKKGDPNTKNIDGDTHSSFSKPTKVKWGVNYR